METYNSNFGKPNIASPSPPSPLPRPFPSPNVTLI